MNVMAKQTQVQKFKQAARDLEADDNEKRFTEKLGKIAKQRPADPPKKSKKENDDDRSADAGRALLTGKPGFFGKRVTQSSLAAC
jgi:hypothetical protein